MEGLPSLFALWAAVKDAPLESLLSAAAKKTGGWAPAWGLLGAGVGFCAGDSSWLS